MELAILCALHEVPEVDLFDRGEPRRKILGTPIQSQIGNYLANFCSDSNTWPAPWTLNSVDKRPAMIQPYPYWMLVTPLAYIIGLYTNVVNGGMLDDPQSYPTFTDGPQYKWLVAQLQSVANLNNSAAQKKAVLLTLHYPPYSGAANFNVRGDQSQGKSTDAASAPYLAVAIQQAFQNAGQRPDVIYSAHAHLFQRLTYTFADGSVMPCIIAGCGGHFSPGGDVGGLLGWRTGTRPDLPNQCGASRQVPAPGQRIGGVELLPGWDKTESCSDSLKPRYRAAR